MLLSRLVPQYYSHPRHFLVFVGSLSSPRVAGRRGVYFFWLDCSLSPLGEVLCRGRRSPCTSKTFSLPWEPTATFILMWLPRTTESRMEPVQEVVLPVTLC